MSLVSVAAFYCFFDFPEFRDAKDDLLAFCEERGLKGTILLAAEGINGTVAGSREGLEALVARFNEDPRIRPLELKWSEHDAMPFYRMKVRLKKEIVTLGIEGVSPVKQVGTYVDPQDWNDLISDPEVTVIDTRNDYEVEIGTFECAIDPHTASFREFPDYVAKHLDPRKQKRVAMFCTGGIRCEKATAYMLEQGFQEVYHLKGGILNYLEKVDPDESLWHGDCFVFDQRVAVDHHLQKGAFELCRQCRHPLSPEDRESPKFELGVSCPHCHDTLTPEKIASARERQKQIELAAQRNEQHLGRD